MLTVVFIAAMHSIVYKHNNNYCTVLYDMVVCTYYPHRVHHKGYAYYQESFMKVMDDFM